MSIFNLFTFKKQKIDDIIYWQNETYAILTKINGANIK